MGGSSGSHQYISLIYVSICSWGHKFHRKLYKWGRMLDWQAFEYFLQVIQFRGAALAEINNACKIKSQARTADIFLNSGWTASGSSKVWVVAQRGFFFLLMKIIKSKKNLFLLYAICFTPNVLVLFVWWLNVPPVTIRLKVHWNRKAPPYNINYSDSKNLQTCRGQHLLMNDLKVPTSAFVLIT